MTGRGAALLLACCVPVAIAAAVPALLVPALVLIAAAVVAVVVDGRRAPGRDRLHVERLHQATLALGRPGEIRLRLGADGLGAEGARALVQDEAPPDLRPSIAVSRVALRSTPEATEVAYTLTPPSRGVRSFGRVVVRVEGPLRLGTRQTAVDLGVDDVLVDPDLSTVGAYEALARRGQLAELGVRTLRRRGEGGEFERIRDAVPEDPLRSINWRATARTSRLMATELIPERAQPVILCLDHGRLMGVGAGELTKLDHAISAALLLAHVALRTGDRAGLVAFADSVTALVPPRPGRAQLQAILEGVRPLRAADVEADYEQVFVELSRRQSRRALLVILTDVLDADQGAALVAQALRLRRRHVPLVVTVRDRALDTAAAAAPVDARAVYSRAAAGQLLAERSAVLRRLRVGGVDTIDADPAALSPRLVNRYLEIKRRGRI